MSMVDNRRMMVPNSVQVPSASIPTTIQQQSIDPSAADADPLSIPMPTNIPSSEVPVSTEQIPEESTQEEPKLRHFYLVDPSTPEPENPNQFIDPEVLLVKCCKS